MDGMTINHIVSIDHGSCVQLFFPSFGELPAFPQEWWEVRAPGGLPLRAGPSLSAEVVGEVLRQQRIQVGGVGGGLVNNP